MLLNRAFRGVAARVGHVKAMSTLPRPEIDEDGLLEYSVVYTDRTLNHMCVCHLLVLVLPSPPGWVLATTRVARREHKAACRAKLS